MLYDYKNDTIMYHLATYIPTVILKNEWPFYVFVTVYYFIVSVIFH